MNMSGGKVCSWRYIHDCSDYDECKYVVLDIHQKVIDALDDLKDAQKLADETVGGQVYDTYEGLMVY
jgi:hypothetical protein